MHRSTEEQMMRDAEMKSRANKLKDSSSPYLLQHAYNPVQWYPWGDEAFEKARREDKPVFLSIGYSTCHWCHVMEDESFEDTAVAGLMNEHLVSIKVDREERPDIDNIYMSVCQMMTGSGGWPLTIIMTPDKKPFFAGTYLPKTARFGRLGMMELIPQVSDLWNNNRDRVLESAGKITDALRDATMAPATIVELDERTLTEAFDELEARFDDRNGGFEGRNKFPIPHNHLFLLRYWKRTGNERALEMVEKTLTKMRQGGIYDHIGFGFHRYSTDPEWLLPHFEKMLYDQAMLSLAYLETFQVTRKLDYLQTARDVFDYVLRDMTDRDGGFYSAEDADSEGEEGKFYVWSVEELQDILGPDAELVIQAYNASPHGNYQEESTGEQTGTNILYLKADLSRVAEWVGKPEEELHERLKDAREKLLVERERRVRPYRDDKILADWNGLMIAALARGGMLTADQKYTKAAKDAADFVLERMRAEDGRLLHRYRDGKAGVTAFLDDYAFIVWGLIELYEASFDIKYLKSAIELNDQMLEHFKDRESGGFYFSADDSEELIHRTREVYDGAVPSGNSVAMLNLLRISRITGDSELENVASELGSAFSATISRLPSNHTMLMAALDFAMGPSYEIVLAGNPESDDMREMLYFLHSVYVPNRVLLNRPDGESPEIAKIAAYTANQKPIEGSATAYICENFNCKMPTNDISQMVQLLRE